MSASSVSRKYSCIRPPIHPDLLCKRPVAALCFLVILCWLVLTASAAPTQAQSDGTPPLRALSPLPRLLPSLELLEGESPLAVLSRIDDDRSGAYGRRQGDDRQRDERRFHPGKRAYMGAAFAVSTGVLAWLSKREADDSYDHYLHAAGSERQKAEFDRAERYDRLSGAAFAAMEVGILMIAYFTFF